MSEIAEQPTDWAAFQTRISGFLGQWTQLKKQERALPQPALDERLKRFIHQWRTRSQLTPESLTTLLASLDTSFTALRESGAWIDVWGLTGIGQDEVKNTRVLSWLLDAKGSHGMGSIFLEALLEASTSKGKVQSPVQHYFANRDPEAPVENYAVRNEVSYGSSGENRLDIEIDGRHFYLIVEVKINAGEGNAQLQRYVQDAQERCGERPWVLIYLTRNSKKLSNYHAHESDDVETARKNGYVIECSWTEFAKHAVRRMSSTSSFGYGNHSKFVTLSFLKHIKGFS